MELLNKIQNKILTVFPDILDSNNFYLTGGTALSYFYLQHRKSNDLDFFTSLEEIILPFSRKLEDALNTHQMVIQRHRGIHSFVELSAEKGNESTIVHLAYDSAFRFEQTKEFPEFHGLKVDSFIDIAVNKLLALFGRANLRDFIDVFYLVKTGKFNPDELMEKAKIKDPGFDLYWLGVALERINIFKDDSPEMLLILSPVDFKELLAFFNLWRDTISKRLA